EDVAMIDATRLRTADEKAFYVEQGDIVHPELHSQDEGAVLRSALAETLEESKGLTESNEKFSVTRGDDRSYSVRRIFDPIKHHQAFYDAMCHPRILDAVEALI